MRILSLLPLLMQALLLGSVGLGLGGLLLTAFGQLPSLGGSGFGLGAFGTVLAFPGLVPAVGATLISGSLATVVATGLSLALVAAINPRGAPGVGPGARLAQRVALGLLAMPHAALALGLAFLLAPSGWVLRGLAAVLGFARPPDYFLLNDSLGCSLALALAIKETPFLFAVALAALKRIEVDHHLRAAIGFGYAPHLAWCKVVLPRLYPQIRLPVLAVLAYSLSVVDMSLILGPTAPPTLSVLILRWINDPDLAWRLPAAAAAVLQILLVGAAFGLWHLGEAGLRHWLRPWLSAGGRDWPPAAKRLGRLALWLGAGLPALLGVIAVLGMALWSIAEVWRFPSVLPQSYSSAAWQRATLSLFGPLGNSIGLAAAAVIAALLAAIGCLEFEARRVGVAAGRRVQWMLYLPLLTPEVSFLFGLQVLLVVADLGGSAAAVLWFHLLFVFPYVFLTLSEPWRALDDRYQRTARCLGIGPWRVLLRVKMPMLKGPILNAAALGFAVSLSLYMPTVLAGAGRITTLATEAIAVSAGGDRRIIGVYAVLQAVVAWIGFGLALVLSRPRPFARLETSPVAG
jgi:putative thiamine transport system permease protein